MQVAPQPIFDLTTQERTYLGGPLDWSQASRHTRFHYPTKDVVQSFYAKAPQYNLGTPPPKPRTYDPSVTVPAFNAWVDRQFDIRLSQIEEMRNKAKFKLESEETLKDFAPKLLEAMNDPEKSLEIAEHILEEENSQ